MFCVSPTVAATEAEARARWTVSSRWTLLEQSLVGISSNTEIDFSQFDVDQPLPDVLPTASAAPPNTSCAVTAARPETLRQLAIDWATTGVEFIGTPEQVAQQDGRDDGGDRW